MIRLQFNNIYSTSITLVIGYGIILLKNRKVNHTLIIKSIYTNILCILLAPNVNEYNEHRVIFKNKTFFGE